MLLCVVSTAGLMAAAALLYNALVWIGAPLAIRNVCVFFAPIMSSATALFTYFLTREVCLSPRVFSECRMPV